MKYKVIIYQEAFQDIQDATDWYNLQVQGLGSKFLKQTRFQINSLKNNPKIYSIRYSNIRCMIINNFPFMVHYKVDDINMRVEIFAIIHTSRNPKIWELRKK